MGAVAASGAAAQHERPSFDHDTTRFPLTGRHELANCESCHRHGRFAGTPTSCTVCHTGGSDFAETAPSARHIAIQTSCSDCHTTRFWEPARMDHTNVGDDCAGCHLVGGPAGGKSPDHVPSSNLCGDCHGTIRWENARFDHGSVTGSCFGCHNGITATGKHAGHIASSNDCELCHSTRAWVPAGFDHSMVVPGSCSSCHDGSSATGQPGGHFGTTLSCDRCHATRSWLPASFDHAGAAYPGDHRVGLDCIDCHRGNSQVVTWTAPAYQPDCAGCHASDFEAGPHRGATVSELRNCAGACHESPEHSVRSREW